MPQSRAARIVFALVVVAVLLVMGRSWLRRYAQSGLERAAQNGDGAFARRMLWLGADPNRAGALWDREEMGQTPLCVAAVNRNGADVVAALLAAGANPNKTPTRSEPPLLIAIRAGAVENVRLLLARGANLHVIGIDGADCMETTLRFRDRNVQDSARMVDLLKERGERLSLLQAAEQGDLDALEHAGQSGDSLNARNRNGQTALDLAIASKQPAIVRWLLAHKADFNAPDKSGQTPLMHAAIRGDVELTKQLLAAGADKRARTPTGQTAWSLARYGRYYELARLVWTETALNVKEDTGEAWNAAARAGDVETLHRLLAAGKDVNARDAQGRTALLTLAAVMQYTANMQQSLSVKGAGIYEGMRAAEAQQELAKKLSLLADQKRAWKLLLAQGANVNVQPQGANVNVHDKGDTPLLLVAANYPEMVKDLLDKGANVNAVNAKGETPLMLAVQNRSTDSARRLLAKGAYIKVVNNEGDNALMLAARYDADIIPLLLARGADVNQTDSQQWTPLLAAASQGNVGAVRLLLARHADVRAQTHFGLTALDYARRKHHQEIVTLLEQAAVAAQP